MVREKERQRESERDRERERAKERGNGGQEGWKEGGRKIARRPASTSCIPATPLFRWLAMEVEVVGKWQAQGAPGVRM